MVFLEELACAMRNHEMIAVYADACDHDFFFAGYVQAVDESGLLLSKQNYGGYPSGFVFFRDILYFQKDTLDTKRHEKLYQLRGIKPECFTGIGNGYLLDEILHVCCKEQLCVNIFKKEDDEGDQLGFLDELHDTYLIFKSMNIYGEYMGKTYLEKSDIFRIFIEGEYEQTCRMLHQDKILESQRKRDV